MFSYLCCIRGSKSSYAKKNSVFHGIRFKFNHVRVVKQGRDFFTSVFRENLSVLAENAAHCKTSLFTNFAHG